MRRLIVASNNNHKIQEIKYILKDFPLQVLGLKESGVNIDVEETGSTFLENAEIKARAIFDICDNDMILADDSGLAVDILNGDPGIFSARYSGDHGNSIENNKKLMKNLNGKGIEERTAQFICAMVLIIDKNTIIRVEEVVEGFITEEYEICDGFGYDPIFFVPELNTTFAKVSSEIKNKVSHRAKALEKIKGELNKYL